MMKEEEVDAENNINTMSHEENVSFELSNHTSIKAEVPPSSSVKLIAMEEEVQNETTTDIPRNNSKKDESCLKDVLNEIESGGQNKYAGSKCIGSTAPSLPSAPGLHIKNIGPIPLPITDPYANKIQQVASDEEEGLSNVVCDDDRLIQIEANKFTIQNPAWRQGLPDVVKKAVEGLGVPAILVQAKLYKLVLHKPTNTNGVFNKIDEKDTDKEAQDGKFATLVIQLPSIFTGGSYVFFHQGESQKFHLKNEQAYGCQFVAYYADCDHYKGPITSGFQLALVYSLRYTGEKHMKVLPSALQLYSRGIYLSRLLRNLLSSDSYFCLPLKHTYASSSLARLGVGALKDNDRNKYQILAAAAASNWDFFIIELYRKDYKYGEEDSCGWFKCTDEEKGDIQIGEILDSEGYCATYHKGWMKGKLKLTDLGNGGNILVNELEDDEFWQDIDRGEVEDSDYGYRDIETTHKTYALVALPNLGIFERICNTSFVDALDKLERDPLLLPQIMLFLQIKQPSISSDQCLKLLSLQPSDHVSPNQINQSLDTILPCLRYVPEPMLASEIVNIVKTYGGLNAVTASVKNLLNRDSNIGESFCCKRFLDVIDFCLSMSTSDSVAEFLGNSVPDAITMFNQHTNNRDTSQHVYFYEDENDENKLSRKIHTMTVRHTWPKVKEACIACFLRLGKCGCKSLKNLFIRANFLVPLHEIPVSDWHSLCEEIASDFVNNIQFFLEANNSVCAILSSTSTDFDNLCKILFQQKNQEAIKRMKLSMSKISIERLGNMLTLFRRVLVIESESIAVKKEVIKRLEDLERCLKIEDLQKKQTRLLDNIRCGRRTFSFCMPNTNTGCTSLDKILASPSAGPTTIILDCKLYARSLADSCKSDPLHSGFCASITVGEDKDKKVSITVTKSSRTFFELTLAKCRENLEELKIIEVKLERLGVLNTLHTASLLADDFEKIRKIDKLRKKQMQLRDATCGGILPQWPIMPNANTGCSSLDRFLASSSFGPITLIVGKNILYARSLADLADSSTSDPVRNGFSASITAGESRGRKASITVTKTRDFYDLILSRHREDLKELEKIEIELGNFGDFEKTLNFDEIQKTFSFCMPNANTGCPSLDTFLASPSSGPTKVVVGESMLYAKSLADNCKFDPLRSGFRVSIASGKGKGKDASITVTKIRSSVCEFTLDQHTACQSRKQQEDCKLLSSDDGPIKKHSRKKSPSSPKKHNLNRCNEFATH